MAKRTRKQKQRATTRRPGPGAALDSPRPMPAAPGQVEDAPRALGVPASGSASVAVDITTPDPGRRRVQRVSAAAAPVARARPGREQAAGYIQPLESEDAAIPFDRVPYVPADLRRVAIIAAVMVALIIVADIIVSNVVK